MTHTNSLPYSARLVIGWVVLSAMFSTIAACGSKRDLVGEYVTAKSSRQAKLRIAREAGGVVAYFREGPIEANSWSKPLSVSQCSRERLIELIGKRLADAADVGISLCAAHQPFALVAVDPITVPMNEFPRGTLLVLPGPHELVSIVDPQMRARVTPYVKPYQIDSGYFMISTAAQFFGERGDASSQRMVYGSNMHRR